MKQDSTTWVIDGLQGSLEENIERTVETRHYNQELQESMEQQVFVFLLCFTTTPCGQRPVTAHAHPPV